MLELLSPAGSPEGVVAAVQNGADAIYLGFREFNACVDAENFTFDEFGRALEYCRVRGVKGYMALDALASDRELPIIAHQVKEACRYGVDAIILQDLGVMAAVKQAVPSMPIHASARMSIHNLEGVKMAAAMGFTRVTVAHELSRKKIYHICRYSPIEIEVFVHGHLCMSYAGQCYMSGMLGNKYNNRGFCEAPCQMSLSAAGHAASHPLSFKDNCLVRYLTDLESIGVTAVKIEGRSRRPEYTALVTGMYSRAARSQKSPSRDTLSRMQNTFSKQGFTDGFYTDRKDTDMIGLREWDTRPDSALFSSTRKNYLNGEFQRVPIRFVGSVESGKNVKLAAADDRNNSSVVYGPVPESSFHKDFTLTALKTQLHKTSGTPFVCLGVKGKVEPGLTLPTSAFGDMRQEVFAEILEQRRTVTQRSEGEFIPGSLAIEDLTPDDKEIRLSNPTVITASVARSDQLSDELRELGPKILYIPLTELDYESSMLRGFLEDEKITVSVLLPRIIHDNEKKKLSGVLRRAESLGVRDALVGSIGHIQFAKSHGMSVRGDFGLNVYNSEALFVLQKLGLRSATLSFELRLTEIRDMTKPIDTELITYGRLPLMITEACIVRNCTDACTCDSFTGLVGKQGTLYPVLPDYGCRNILLHSKKLFLADKSRATATLGIWAQRLSFTTENAIECVTIMKRYMGKGNYSPSGYTRGLYFNNPA